MGARAQHAGSSRQFSDDDKGKYGGGAHLNGRRLPPVRSLACTLAAVILPVAVVAIVGRFACRRRGSPTHPNGCPLHCASVSV